MFKETNSDKKQLKEECIRKQKAKDELNRKIAEVEVKLAESIGGMENHKGELVLTKKKGDQYWSFISSNFYEFCKIRNMLEAKEKDRIIKLFPERAEEVRGDMPLSKKSLNSNSE